MTHTVIVVPCFNEERRLDRPRFRQFDGGGRDIRLLLVDDGSRDATPSVLAHLARENPHHVGVLAPAPNGGKAEAVRQGILRAIAQGADYVGFWDADLATALAEIPRFCDVLDRRPAVSAVFGSRLQLLGHGIRRSRLRQFLGRLFARAASLALRLRIQDTQCGAKLFRVTPAVRLVFAEPFHTRWIFDVEILARLKHTLAAAGEGSLNSSVFEQPLDDWQDVAGSKLKRSDFVRAAGELGGIYWRYLRPGATPYLPADERQAAEQPELRENTLAPRRAA